jgi:hypothetical protein
LKRGGLLALLNGLRVVLRGQKSWLGAHRDRRLSDRCERDNLELFLDVKERFGTHVH